MDVFKSKMSFIEYGADGTEQQKNAMAQYRSSEARARAALTGERISLTDRKARRPLAKTAATASHDRRSRDNSCSVSCYVSIM